MPAEVAENVHASLIPGLLHGGGSWQPARTEQAVYLAVGVDGEDSAGRAAWEAMDAMAESGIRSVA